MRISSKRDNCNHADGLYSTFGSSSCHSCFFKRGFFDPLRNSSDLGNSSSVLALVPVESAFNGLAVYDMLAVFPSVGAGDICQYVGKGGQGVDGESDDTHDCEHVSFH